MIPNLIKQHRYTNSFEYKEMYFELLNKLYKITNHNLYKYKEIKILIEKEVQTIQKFTQKPKKQTRLTHYEKE